MKVGLVSVSRMPLEWAASLTMDVVIVLGVFVTVHAGVFGRFSTKSENESLANALRSKEF